MSIEYTQILIGSNKGVVCNSSLANFLLKMPGLGITIKYAKVIPPIYIINEFLCKGENNSGMSGVFFWTPQRIDEREYRSLVDDLKRIIGNDAIILDSGKRISLSRWLSMARDYYDNNTKA